MEEILNLAYKEITRSGFEDILAAGIVLTGGTAILQGITELAEHIFNMPVRRGCPTGIGGLTDVVNSPLYATGVGLVLYASRHIVKDGSGRPDAKWVGGVVSKTKKWFSDFF